MKTILFTLAVAIALLLVPPADSGDKHAKRANIVLILADDLGYGDPHCFNKDSLIPTPHIDRLAAQGMRFTDAHAPAAVCTPTRYGILTGRYCWRGRLKESVLFGYDPMLIEPGRMTIASLLHLYDYLCACIGKWHLGLGNLPKTDYTKELAPGPRSVGFDYFFGIAAPHDMPPYVYIENERMVQAPNAWIKASAPQRFGGAGFWRAGPIAPDYKHQEVQGKLTDKAVEFILWTPEDITQWKHLANGQLHGQKGDIWEGGHRIPFIARWPGKVKAGTTSAETICLVDLLATTAAIVGKKLPADAAEDSFSILPVLLGEKLAGPVRPATVLHSYYGSLAIRQGPWRLTNALGSRGFSSPASIKPRPGGARGELYNLEEDPEEKNNRWSQEPEVVRRLTALLEKIKDDGRSRQP
jgi:arylsulfatase A